MFLKIPVLIILRDINFVIEKTILQTFIMQTIAFFRHIYLL